MNCKEARRYINLFIDSELDSKASFEIAEHLSSCEDCKRFKQEEHIEKTLVSVLKDSKDPKQKRRGKSSFRFRTSWIKRAAFGSWFYKRYVVLRLRQFSSQLLRSFCIPGRESTN